MEDHEAREFIILVSEGYKRRKNEKNLYNSEDHIPQAIINIYYSCVQKPKFSIVMEKYKREYILNESMVEFNATKNEKKGLGVVYDYISQFDFETEKFNLFTASVLIHQKLYSKCIGSDFGGKIRENQAVLNDVNIEVPTPKEAREYFNKFILNSDFIFEPLKKGNIIEYIDQCIFHTTELIKVQPFADGNKRTFRALLNMLLKKINIPPIYIENQEREEYKKCLLLAMREQNYSQLIRFYHYKICDAIVELDVKNSEIKSEFDEVCKKQ